jgi:hypothetical protein
VGPPFPPFMLNKEGKACFSNSTFACLVFGVVVLVCCYCGYLCVYVDI